jgi:predicted nucleic acid-binding protein
MSNLSKLDSKKLQILNERRSRLMNKGVSAEKVDEVIAREDYERLPSASKIERLESILVGSLKGVQEDINKLHSNQRVLADSMDINFLAFTKMLAVLGVTAEQQKAIVSEAETEFMRERDKQDAERVQLMKEAQEAAVVEDVDVPGEIAAPEGATTFGG